MADYESIHSGPTIDERVALAATNQADIAALKARMSSAETAINTKADASTVSSELAGKADTSTVNAALATKQNTLVPGENIKTVNGESILGVGNIDAGDVLLGRVIEDNVTINGL